jgi:hypothetical protein
MRLHFGNHVRSGMAEFRRWHEACVRWRMWKKFARLFVIKTRLDALFVIYALALGAVERGQHYLEQYPGPFGYLLFAACTGAVFMGGAKILEVTRPESREGRRSSDGPAPSPAPAVSR